MNVNAQCKPAITVSESSLYWSDKEASSSANLLGSLIYKLPLVLLIIFTTTSFIILYHICHH